MSAKSILRCGKSVIFKQIKDACERTRFYEFRKRLKYKCNINKVNLKIVNEYYILQKRVHYVNIIMKN